VAAQKKQPTKKEVQLAAVLKWEDKLKAASYAIDMLQSQIDNMDVESREYGEYVELLYNSRVSLSNACGLLVIRKAQLGIVGNKYYEPK
jgi:hypothetical protein